MLSMNSDGFRNFMVVTFVYSFIITGPEGMVDDLLQFFTCSKKIFVFHLEVGEDPCIAYDLWDPWPQPPLLNNSVFDRLYGISVI